jgi:hypothetical protein
MSSEVFRFVTIRPPRPAEGSDTSDDVVDLALSRSTFVDALRRARSTGSRATMIGVVAKFTGSADFVDSPLKLDRPFVDFVERLQQLPDTGFWQGAAAAFTSTFGSDPSAFVEGAVYTKAYTQTSDSIVAAAIDRSVQSQARSFLVRIARSLWLARRLAAGTPVSRSAFAGAVFVLPAGIFPLPVSDVDLKSLREKQSKAMAAAADARRQRLAQLAADLAEYRNAAEELVTAFERSAPQTAPAAQPRTDTAPQSRAAPGFVLPDAAAQSLSDATKAAFQKVGIPATRIDVAKTVALLDRQALSTANQLYAGTGSSGAMVRIGNSIIPRDALADGYTTVVDPGPPGTQVPGPCPPAAVTTPPDGSATVPTGHGDARVLGIADLLVVEQELLRYELGEVSRIENVLKSEVRSRRFKTTDTTEQTQTTETETTKDKEQDLSSSERFELKTESQTVINQNASKDAGLTIHASYGPSVDATANYNTSSTTSTQQSNAASTNYAREITTKAVDRVQTRTLTRRTVTTINVLEEVNRHAFDNKDGPSDIVGIYRYVDKIYHAQIVNHGKRLMLEFSVPEPAAFLRYALTNKPIDTVSLVNPDPPGYCLGDGTTFVPLQATDITIDNYIYWVSKYGAQDASPPPAGVFVATGSTKSPDSMATLESDGPRKISSVLFDVKIPDGYLCQNAFVNIYGETQAGLHKIVYQLQEQQGEYVEPWQDNVLYTLQPTPTLTVTVNSLGFHNYEIVATAFCTLSQGTFQEWQLQTFASIMNAYNAQKSTYDLAVQEAKLRASDATISGTNPENNTVTAQTELKKGCISLLTGQRFDLFDAVARNAAPFGYPEIDFAEAKAEGAYLSFFEQSFEWNNMVYVFYPYFWGKKDGWVTVAQLTDNDPLFGQFLRAGAARVQVPVRVGFEEAMLTYLSTGEVWAGEGTLVNSENGSPDPLHLSIVAELKSQTGNDNVEGVGTLSVTNGSPAIAGTGTAFTSDDDSKRIVIAGVTYVIKAVENAQTIVLTAPYAGTSGDGLGYAIGGKLVGQPWEVKLPTDLVKLDGSLVIS